MPAMTQQLRRRAELRDGLGVARDRILVAPEVAQSSANPNRGVLTLGRFLRRNLGGTKVCFEARTFLRRHRRAIERRA